MELAAAVAKHPGQRIYFGCASVYLHSIQLGCCPYLVGPVAVALGEFCFAMANTNFHSIVDLGQWIHRIDFVNCTCLRRTSIADAVVAAAGDDEPLRIAIVGAAAMWAHIHRHLLTDSFAAAQSNSVDFGIGRSCMQRHRRR